MATKESSKQTCDQVVDDYLLSLDSVAVKSGSHPERTLDLSAMQSLPGMRNLPASRAENLSRRAFSSSLISTCKPDFASYPVRERPGGAYLGR